MRTAVILFAFFSSLAFGHEMKSRKNVEVYPAYVDKTIAIDIWLKNNREDAAFGLFVMEENEGVPEKIPYFSLQRKFYLENGEVTQQTVYVENNKPLPREIIVCSETLNVSPKSIICLKTKVESSQ